MILTPLQKLPYNVGGLGEIIVATGFKWLPKVQKLSQSGHTAPYLSYLEFFSITSFLSFHFSPLAESCHLDADSIFIYYS